MKMTVIRATPVNMLRKIEPSQSLFRWQTDDAIEEGLQNLSSVNG